MESSNKNTHEKITHNTTQITIKSFSDCLCFSFEFLRKKYRGLRSSKNK